MRRTAFLLALAAVLAAVPVSAQQSVGDYRVGPKDLLEIRVFEIPELNLERRVTDTGTLDLPLLGQFSVAGLTAEEVRDRLQALLTAKYVNRANVSVVVKEFANKPISILGAVGKPGSLNVSGRWDLLQAISAAGGLASGAGRKIFVLRHADNGLTDRLEIDTDELFRKSSPIWNIPIFPSDVVNIPSRSTVKIFVLGEVKTPGSVEFDTDDRITLLSLIAKAGGLTDRAAKGSIRIKRRNPDGKDKEFVVDYARIVKGKDQDPDLKPDDVVIVKESFF
jgi:polysaccharide export outer membrane protein